MNFKDNIRIALFSIKTNLMRSLLTMLGIVIGVASVIAIITVGNGGRDYIVNMIKDMGGSSIVNISVKTSATASDYITPDDISAIKNLEEVDFVSPVAMGIGSINTKYDQGFGIIIGGNTDMLEILGNNCNYGRFFTQQEYLSASNVALIDPASAVAMFGTENCVGEQITYTSDGRSATIRIIGVMDILGMFSDSSSVSMMDSIGGSMGVSSCMLLIPATLSVKLTDTQERYDTIYISCTDEKKLSGAGDVALSIIQARHGNIDRDVYRLTNLAQFVDLINTVITIFTTFIAAVGAISLIVGGVGVMNIMLVSVTERTREIGIRKALGARTATILFQFLTESVVICFIGGVVGLLLGISIASIVSSLMSVPLVVKVWTVVLAVGFSSAIGLFFGIYPAKKAADLPPIEALRKE